MVDLKFERSRRRFAGETHEWKGWSFKMRQYTAAVDEELYLELLNVEAFFCEKWFLTIMNEFQRRRAR